MEGSMAPHTTNTFITRHLGSTTQDNDDDGQSVTNLRQSVQSDVVDTL